MPSLEQDLQQISNYRSYGEHKGHRCAHTKRRVYFLTYSQERADT